MEQGPEVVDLSGVVDVVDGDGVEDLARLPLLAPVGGPRSDEFVVAFEFDDGADHVQMGQFQPFQGDLRMRRR